MMEEERESYKYYAFISYSHKDQKIARKLQKSLESYHLPSALQKANPELPKKLTPVFLDESDLVSIGSLDESLKKNLDSSNYLIVICSPDSAKSKYVNAEVSYFIETGRRDHIIPLIIGGVPDAEDESAECFTPAIRRLKEEGYELLGIDFQKFGVRDAFLRVIATMFELDLDSFVSREAQNRKRRAVMFALAGSAFLIVLGMIIRYSMGTFNLMEDAALVIVAGVLVRYSIYTFSLMQGNDAMTQCGFGVIYEKKGNYAKAKEWYEKSAAQGYALARFNLGNMYAHGTGVEQDYAKAIDYYEQAAAQGLADAQVNLGYMYYSGQGVAQDYTKAIYYCEQAAAQNTAEAQSNLGVMYYNGCGVKRDYVKAREWFEKAAAQGNASAQCNLGIIYSDGHGVEQDYVKAREYFEQAAAQNMAEAQYNLSYIYQHGLGTERDYAKAKELYEKAAANGSASALLSLGYMYYSGKGAGQDYAKAREYFEQAAAQGMPVAQFNLGIMHRDGLSVPQSTEKAIEYFTQAAAQGLAKAKTELDRLRRETKAQKLSMKSYSLKSYPGSKL